MEKFQIYLAGGVLNEPDSGEGWRNKAALIFQDHIESENYRVVTFDPTKFFSYSDGEEHMDKQIKTFYFDQIKHSRVVMVNLNRSKFSVGTGMEVQYAADLGIPVIGFGEEDIYPWLLVDCQVVFPSMLQAIDYIKEFYVDRL